MPNGTRPQMGDELLPCPFCGGTPRFGEVEGDPEQNTDVGGHFIACAKCGCSTPLVFPLKESAKPKLTEMWNRRSQSEGAVRTSGVGERLLSAAKLLLANCVACVEQHHGRDTASNGLPQWLADAKADIEAASLPQPPAGSTGENAAYDSLDWVLVPRKPTPEMLTAKLKSATHPDGRLESRHDLREWIWGAMIKAAPLLPSASTPAQSGMVSDALDEAMANLAHLIEVADKYARQERKLTNVPATMEYQVSHLRDGLRKVVTALSRPSQPAPVVVPSGWLNEARQHVGWLKQYTEGMSPENWRDMRDRAMQQLSELSKLLRASPQPDRESEKCRHPNRGLARCTLKRIGDTEHFICQTIGCASMPSTSSTRPQATEGE